MWDMRRKISKRIRAGESDRINRSSFERITSGEFELRSTIE